MRFLRYSLRAALKISKAHLTSPRVKGFIGEQEVREALKEEKYVINNIKIKNGQETQIDHIVINDKGILVIETKNYRGYIKGNTNQKFWVQLVNNRQYMFYNPLVQNNFHIEVLKKLFPEYKDYFVSIVVFTNRSNVIVKHDNLTYLSKLTMHIADLPKKELNERIEGICNNILSLITK